MEKFNLLQEVVPESVDLLKKRFKIIKAVYSNQPIGRRTLSHLVSLTERSIRTEIEILKTLNLVDMTPLGVELTDEGKNLFVSLIPIMESILDLTSLEDRVQEILKIKKVSIVPGNVEEEKSILKEMGIVAFEHLKSNLKKDSILALMGGSSVKAMVDQTTDIRNRNDVIIVPGRGGIGNTFEIQANTLVSSLSEKLKCKYKVLHVPDRLSDESLNALLKEKEIRETANIIEKANILVCGIGIAETMAKRRNLPIAEIELIKKGNAKGETCGAFFDKDGKVVLKSKSLGLSVEDIKNLDCVIAICGGKEKAEAALSVKLDNKNTILVTDESCALEIVNLMAKRAKNIN